MASSKQISLREFGYGMSKSEQERRDALDLAVQKCGIDPVLARLTYITVNKQFEEQTRSDMAYLTSMNDDVSDDDACDEAEGESDQKTPDEMESIAIKSIEHINKKLAFAIEQKKWNVVKTLIESLNVVMAMIDK